MKGFKKIISRFDLSVFKKYTILSFVILVALFILSRLEFTEAKYVTNTEATVSPNIAFFIVNVSTQSASMKLANLIPSEIPYTYEFQVSNFKGAQKANVDLTYSIEVIATNNLPLEIKLFSGTNTNQTPNFTETLTTNSDGVYFKHLLYNSVATMSHSTRQTDTYTLWVEFPESCKNSPDSYAGIIELVDIKINAEQVV